jgi:hypothetical protein
VVNTSVANAERKSKRPGSPGRKEWAGDSLSCRGKKILSFALKVR